MEPDASWTVKTRGVVGTDAGGSVKTRGFVDPSVVDPGVQGGVWKGRFPST